MHMPKRKASANLSACTQTRKALVLPADAFCHVNAQLCRARGNSSGLPSDGCQRLLQIRQQVVDVFDTD